MSLCFAFISQLVSRANTSCTNVDGSDIVVYGAMQTMVQDGAVSNVDVG